MFKEEPIRVIQAVFTFIGAVVAVLIGADIVSATTGGVIVAVMAAANQFAQEIFGRAAVKPLVKVEREIETQMRSNTPFGFPPAG